jgi:hypothetical protein
VPSSINGIQNKRDPAIARIRRVLIEKTKERAALLDPAVGAAARLVRPNRQVTAQELLHPDQISASDIRKAQRAVMGEVEKFVRRKLVLSGCG